MNATLNFTVMENQIDCLLLEEFYTSKSFVKWFLENTCGANKGLGLLSCIHYSKKWSNGEIDIQLDFINLDENITFLIENKVDASFQDKQPQRYTQYGNNLIHEKKCKRFFTVLIAPERYLQTAEDKDKFDYCISYQNIIKFFNIEDPLYERFKYKKEILNKAIKKQSSKKEIDEDTQRTEFFRKYYNDIQDKNPEIQMQKPGKKGSGSSFIHLCNKQLPKHVSIVHKFELGYVDLKFERIGNFYKEFTQIYRDNKETDMEIKRDSNTIFIRITVPEIDHTLDYEHIQDFVLIAQNTVKRLLNWFNSHQELWYQFELSISQK